MIVLGSVGLIHKINAGHKGHHGPPEVSLITLIMGLFPTDYGSYPNIRYGQKTHYISTFSVHYREKQILKWLVMAKHTQSSW